MNIGLVWSYQRLEFFIRNPETFFEMRQRSARRRRTYEAHKASLATMVYRSNGASRMAWYNASHGPFARYNGISFSIKPIRPHTLLMV